MRGGAVVNMASGIDELDDVVGPDAKSVIRRCRVIERRTIDLLELDLATSGVATQGRDAEAPGADRAADARRRSSGRQRRNARARLDGWRFLVFGALRLPDVLLGLPRLER